MEDSKLTIKVIHSVVSGDSITIPRKEYDELVKARFGIDAIAASHSKYGYDNDVILAVMNTLGYEHKEAVDA